MKKIVLTYGLLSGAILGCLLLVTAPLIQRGTINFENGMFYGFATMILGFSLIYFAIASFKKNNGSVSFKQGLVIGLLITIIGCFVYALVWTAFYSTLFADFGPSYRDYMIKQINASGISADKKAAEIAKITKDMATYDSNAMYRFAYTFLEPTIVGVLITLIATLILFTRKRQKPSLA